MKQGMMKSKVKSIISNQYIYQQGQVVTFLLPSIGKVKGKVLGTEYTALSGYTVTISIENHGLMDINEKFLQRLQQRAA